MTYRQFIDKFHTLIRRGSIGPFTFALLIEDYMTYKQFVAELNILACGHSMEPDALAMLIKDDRFVAFMREEIPWACKYIDKYLKGTTVKMLSTDELLDTVKDQIALFNRNNKRAE